MAYITIPGFSQMKLQTIFDRAVKHIGKTQCQSLGESGKFCIYGGTGCNAAPFIRKDQRDIADARGAIQSGWAHLATDGLVPMTHREFVADLQRAHDYVNPINGNAFLNEYDRNMRRLADDYSLNTKALDKLGWGKLEV